MSKNKIFIFALLPLHAFGFSQRENQVLECNEDQAAEIIEAGYAREATKKEISEYKASKAEVISESESDSINLKSDLETAKAETEAVKSENDQLKADLETAKAETEAVKSENDQLKTDLEAAKADAETAKSEAGQLKIDLEAAQAEIAKSSTVQKPKNDKAETDAGKA